jgi:hypothetical protein
MHESHALLPEVDDMGKVTRTARVSCVCNCKFVARTSTVLERVNIVNGAGLCEMEEMYV